MGHSTRGRGGASAFARRPSSFSLHCKELSPAPTVVPAAYTAMYSESGAIGPRSVVNDVVVFDARRVRNSGYGAHKASTSHVISCKLALFERRHSG